MIKNKSLEQDWCEKYWNLFCLQNVCEVKKYEGKIPQVNCEKWFLWKNLICMQEKVDQGIWFLLFYSRRRIFRIYCFKIFTKAPCICFVPYPFVFFFFKHLQSSLFSSVVASPNRPDLRAIFLISKSQFFHPFWYLCKKFFQLSPLNHPN